MDIGLFAIGCLGIATGWFIGDRDWLRAFLATAAAVGLIVLRTA